MKVSLFLQDGIQSTDGAIIITHKGTMAHGTEVPGTIRYAPSSMHASKCSHMLTFVDICEYDAHRSYFDADGKVNREEKVKLKNTDDVVIATEEFDVTKPTRPCTLGTNLYGITSHHTVVRLASYSSLI